MRTASVIFQVVAAAAVVPGQIDRECRAFCATLAVQDGVVRFIDSMPPTANLEVGRLVGADQRLVPRTEAPIRDLRSPRGWHVVIGASLDHEELVVRLRLHFFSPDGALKEEGELLSALVSTEIGTLFGGTDEILAVTSVEKHSYNDQSEIWLLPEDGKPKLVLALDGSFRTVAGNPSSVMRGITVERQIYDGVHAETKGTVQEFYVWDPKAKSLTLRR